ncbi:MAG: homoserine kinase [Bacillota bacterium]
MLHIKVPATSANMGSGFDSIGVALTKYNHIWVEEVEVQEEEFIEVLRPQEIEIPLGKDNLIYETMVQFFKEKNLKMPNIKMTQEDYIPMVRGMGSSACCIVGGLLAANALANFPCTKVELAEIAARMEGHPDNVVPAIFGGMVIGVQNENDLSYIPVPVPDELVFATMVPEFPMSTHEARAVLPQTYTRDDIIFSSSRTALLTAAMYTKQFDKLAVAMEDVIHQPYRSKLIPNMEEIFEKAKKFGAVGVYLSGAGSTLMAVVLEENKIMFQKQMEAYLQTLKDHWTLYLLKADPVGATVEVEEDGGNK